MTPTAIIMLVVSIVTVWGGLVAGMVNLARHPEQEGSEPTPPIEL